jgi:hypothetical protein
MEDPNREEALQAGCPKPDDEDLDVMPTPTPRRDSFFSGLGMSWTPDDGHPL